MHADIEKAVVEWNSEDGWATVLGDDRQPTVFRVPEQFAGTLPQFSHTETGRQTHMKAPSIVYTNRSINLDAETYREKGHVL